jgi:hypothetical protein
LAFLAVLPAIAYTGQKLAKEAKISMSQARSIILKAHPGKITDEELDSIDGYGPRRRTMMPISVSSSDGRPSPISPRLVIRRLSEKLDDHQPRCQHPRNTLIDVASNDRRGRGSCCG